MLTQILVPLIVFGTIFGIVYIFLTTRNKERLALIEKGADAKLFNSGSPSKNTVSIVVLNIAFLAIAIGIGILLAKFINELGLDEDIAFSSMIFICGGIGLLTGFFVSRKIKDDIKE